MKVLYLLDSINRGGAEFQALDVVKNGEKYGINSIVVAAGGGNLEPEFEKLGEGFIRLQRRYPLDPSLIKKLRRIITENNVQIVRLPTG